MCYTPHSFFAFFGHPYLSSNTQKGFIVFLICMLLFSPDLVYRRGDRGQVALFNSIGGG